MITCCGERFAPTTTAWRIRSAGYLALRAAQPADEADSRLGGKAIRNPSERGKHHSLEIMPTVLQDGPYSFVFFSSDRGEPPHIHVKRDRQISKFWLIPIVLVKNKGFKEHELNQIARLIVKHHEILMEAWHDYFGS